MTDIDDRPDYDQLKQCLPSCGECLTKGCSHHRPWQQSTHGDGGGTQHLSYRCEHGQGFDVAVVGKGGEGSVYLDFRCSEGCVYGAPAPRERASDPDEPYPRPQTKSIRDLGEVAEWAKRHVERHQCAREDVASACDFNRLCGLVDELYRKAVPIVEADASLFEAARAVLSETRAAQDTPAMRELDRAWHDIERKNREAQRYVASIP